MNRDNEAFGGPGLPSAWTSGSKQGVGTAANPASTLWFTLAGGIMSEVYYPTIDKPQVRDLRLVFTDGETFLIEEQDLSNTATPVDEGALGYRTVHEAPDGSFRSEKTIICDPRLPCLLMRVRLAGRAADRIRVYALLAPHLEMEGEGNSGRRVLVSGREILSASKGGVHLAMGADPPFSRTSCGYQGESDGLTDLRKNQHLAWTFGCATEGWIILTGALPAGRKEFTLGVGFGETSHAALTTLVEALSFPFEEQLRRFLSEWGVAGRRGMVLDRASGDGGRLGRLSLSILRGHEDKRYPGAFVASVSIPWGERRFGNDIGGYHMVWTRDMVQAATALLAAGDPEPAHRALAYLAVAQHQDGGFAQNFWINGQPHWSGVQLDQTAFPVILAWRLWKHGALYSFDPWWTVRRAAAYLVRNGPVTQEDRWERNGGYSPSTLAAVITALICAADFAHDRMEQRLAEFLVAYADFLVSRLPAWTVTRQGTILPEIPRHFIRILPARSSLPDAPEDPDTAEVTIYDREPGRRTVFPAREIVDAGFLELVRYGVLSAKDQLVTDSLRVVDHILKVDTPRGPCWRRYSHDGYGEHPDGAPYDGWGVGRAWPLLTGERGHWAVAAGMDPGPYIRAMEAFSDNGPLPEQIWDREDIPGRRLFLARPTGSARPLAWAHAEYLKLLRSSLDGQPFDLVAPVAQRYRQGRGRADLEIWQPTRHPRTVPRGGILRVVGPEPFRLRLSTDGRNSWSDLDSREPGSPGLGLHFADIEVDRDQGAPVAFSMYWLDRDRWEGRDYEVRAI